MKERKNEVIRMRQEGDCKAYDVVFERDGL